MGTNKCDVCGKIFHLNIQLAVHKRQMHSEPLQQASVANRSQPPANDKADFTDQQSHITVHKSVKECILESSKVMDSIAPRETVGIKYTLKSAVQLETPAAPNQKLPSQIMDEMKDCASAIPKGINGSSPSYVLSLANLEYETYAEVDQAVIEPVETKLNLVVTYTDENTETVNVEGPIIQSISSLAEQQAKSKKNSRKSQPFKMDENLRKSPRGRNNNDSSAAGQPDSVRISDPFACVICNKVMCSWVNLIRHYRTRHAGKNNVGNYLPIPLYKPGLLKRWPCKKCGKKFSHVKDLWKHRLNFCGLGSKYKCSKCTVEFRQSFYLHQHKMVHNIMDQDNQSNSVVPPAPIDPELDSMTTAKEDMTEPEILEPAFEEIMKLKREVTLFKCKVPKCFKIFPDVFKLRDHIREVHKVFMCLYCESVLLTQNDLNSHVNKRHAAPSKLPATAYNGANADQKVLLSKEIIIPDTQAPNSISSTPEPEADNNNKRQGSDGNQYSRVDKNAGPYKCGYCSESFEFKVGVGGLCHHILKTHTNKNRDNGRLENGDSSRDTNGKSESDTSSNKRQSESRTCSVCNKTFKQHQLRAFFLHMREHKVSNSVGSVIAQKITLKSTGSLRKTTSRYSSSSESNSNSASSTGNKSALKRALTIVDASDAGTAGKRPALLAPAEVQCVVCDVRFRNSGLLEEHLEIGTCNKKVCTYQCELCQQKFSREASLRNHMNSKHNVAVGDQMDSHTDSESMPGRELSNNEKQRQCSLCSKVFVNAKNLSTHIALYHPTVDKFQEPISVKNIRGGTSTTSPLNRVTLNGEIAGIRIPSDRTSGQNLRQKESVSKKPQAIVPPQGNQHLCTECGDSFSTGEELVQHLLWHNQTRGTMIFRGVRKTGIPQATTPPEVLIKCVICGGGFREYSSMVNHVKMRHTRRGNYACIDCNKRFQRAMDLLDHSAVHNKNFPQQQNNEQVDDEGSGMEEEEEEEDYEEEQVSIPVQRRVVRRSEQQQNVPGREIRCPKCPEKFYNNNDFKAHWKSHIHPQRRQEKNDYICISCHAAFPSVEQLNQHRQTRHPEVKVFYCPFPNCNIPFVHQLGLRRHLSYDHKQNTPTKLNNRNAGLV